MKRIEFNPVNINEIATALNVEPSELTFDCMYHGETWCQNDGFKMSFEECERHLESFPTYPEADTFSICCNEADDELLHLADIAYYEL